MNRFNITKNIPSSSLELMFIELESLVNDNPNDLKLINILKTIGYATIDATPNGHKLLLDAKYICYLNSTRKLVK